MGLPLPPKKHQFLPDQIQMRVTDTRLSFDGRWLAYVSNETGRVLESVGLSNNHVLDAPSSNLTTG
jgi:hypothetical protein